VSRVSNSLDDSLGVMNDRISAIDERFAELEGQIRAIEESVEGVDRHALDEMKEKMSTAAGEAMLVRIEMERFEQTMNERSDSLAVRLTEVETNLQDATMDVSTAVQLDRMEHIERALAELDPDQFVRKDGRDKPESATAPPSVLDGAGAASDTSTSPDIFMMEDSSGTGGRDAFPAAPPPPMPPPTAPPSAATDGSPSGDTSGETDEPHLPGGIDIDSIIAAAEAANEHEK
jgi:hypothetical protein